MSKKSVDEINSMLEFLGSSDYRDFSIPEKTEFLINVRYKVKKVFQEKFEKLESILSLIEDELESLTSIHHSMN